MVRAEQQVELAVAREVVRQHLARFGGDRGDERRGRRESGARSGDVGVGSAEVACVYACSPTSSRCAQPVRALTTYTKPSKEPTKAVPSVSSVTGAWPA